MKHNKEHGQKKREEQKGVVRFGVSLEPVLLQKFDTHIEQEGYRSRSEAIRDLIREKLNEKAVAEEEREGAGTITFLYDHHQRELTEKLLSIQHDTPVDIKANMHVHLSHSLCMEIIACIGKIRDIYHLGDQIKSLRGVLFAEAVITFPEVLSTDKNE